MIVKELIEKLKMFDEDADVKITAKENILDNEVNYADLDSVNFSSYFNKQDTLVKEVELFGRKKRSPSLF